MAENKKYKQYDGWWNGEPALFSVLSVIVGQFTAEEMARLQIKFEWYLPFVGKHRQVIRIDYNNRIFFIDNYDGMGLYKVKEGMGDASLRHRSIKPEKIVLEVHEDDWQLYDHNLITWHDRVLCSYFDSNGGTPFKKALEDLEQLKNKWLFK